MRRLAVPGPLFLVAFVLAPGLLRAPVFVGHPAIHGQSADIAALEHAVAARPDDLEARRRLAVAYGSAGRLLEAVGEWRTLTERAPSHPAGWYALGHAYNAVARAAIRSFDDRPSEAAWQQLLAADGLLQNGHFTDAFVLYRIALEQLPAMVSIHDSVARLYERTGHDDWAAQERTRGILPDAECAARRALCDFRAGRHQAVLDATRTATDSESRYWQARAATELAFAAFARLEALPDSAERRAVRAAIARAEDRHRDAIGELTAARAFAPGNPALTFDLASAYYAASDFEQVVATLAPLVSARPDDPRVLRQAGYALLQLRRLDEAVPLLTRAVERDPADVGARIALGRAHVQAGSFTLAIPLLEPHLAGDQDGSLHVQLARAYAGIGEREKSAALLARSQELHRASEDRKAAAARRTITGPKAPTP